MFIIVITDDVFRKTTFCKENISLQSCCFVHFFSTFLRENLILLIRFSFTTSNIHWHLSHFFTSRTNRCSVWFNTMRIRDICTKYQIEIYSWSKTFLSTFFTNFLYHNFFSRANSNLMFNWFLLKVNNIDSFFSFFCYEIFNNNNNWTILKR